MSASVVRRTVLLAVAALATIAVSACSGPGESDDSPLQTVVLREWAVTKSLLEAPAGDVRFRVRNNGSLEHELVIIKTQIPADNLPVNTAESIADVGASGQLLGEIDPMGGSQEKTGTFSLAAGEYVLICNIPGHYQQGMRTAFTVQ